MPYVRSLTDVLAGYLDWHLSRLKLMARFTSSVLTLTTTNLWKISLALKAAPKQESNYRRIQRFLSGYEVDFTALGILLLHLLPRRPPYEVVIDRTEWHFGETGVNILMVGIAHEGMAFQGMAFPVAWTALPSGGSSNFRVAIRLRSDRRIGRAPEGPSLPARMHARTVDLGSERALEGTRYLSGAQKDGAEEVLVPVRVVTRRIGDEDSDDPSLILATSNVDPAEATEFYKRRWNIEPCLQP